MTLDDAIMLLRKLNYPVPTPMRLPTDEEVSLVERDLGVSFHPDFRKYLLEASDVVYGRFEPATITVPESHTDLVDLCSNAWRDGVPRTFIPICHDNADYYCMSAAGQVIYWSHNGITDERWSDLASWINDVWIGESGR